jgi:hypothetical protein
MTLPYSLKKTRCASALFLIYTLLLAFGLWRHEMWRDELQAWNIVLESKSLVAIFQNIRYEGHPSLWFLLLWPFSLINNSPYVLQLVNLSLAVLTAYIIIFRSPFSLWEKVLILFSYFIFYEYAIISRNYMIGIALLFGIACLFKNFQKNLLPLSFLVLLLFQTNAFMALIAAAILGTTAIKLFQERLLFSIKGISSIIIGALGGILFYLTTKPPADNSFAANWTFTLDPGYATAVIGAAFKGLFPIPAFPVFHWNRHIASNAQLNAGLAIACFILIFWVFRKDKIASLFLLLSFSLLLFFMYVKFIGHPRHHGHFTIALLFAYWITRNSQKPTSFQLQIVFSGVFFVQSVAGVLYAYTDWKYPFSMGKQTANYIKTHFPKDVQLVGAYNDLSTTVCGYLGRKMLFLNDGRYANHVIWKSEFWNHSNYVFEDSVLIDRLAKHTDPTQTTLLVINYRSEEARQRNAISEGDSRLFTAADTQYKVTCLKTFNGALCSDENYLLYKVIKQ